jgi:hypothetical protein
MAEQMFGASSSSRRRRLVQLCLGAGLDKKISKWHYSKFRCYLTIII